MAEWLLYTIYAIVAVMVWLAWTINRVTVKSVTKMLDAEGLFEPVVVLGDQFDAASASFAQWCAQHGYVLDLYLHAHILLVDTPLKVAFWWSDDEKTYAVFYFAPDGQTMFEFITSFGEQDSLGTASGKDAMLLPRPPGSWEQAFPGRTPDELHVRHADACRLLERCGVGARTAAKPETVQVLAEAMMRQARYVTGLPLWRWRGIWWYFVRRNLLADRPVDPRREAG